jgi:hypothetical protein
MRQLAMLSILIAVSALAACAKKAEGAADAGWSPFGTTAKPGRYIGVGIYNPGEVWTRVVHAQPPAQGTMKPADDQAIIVVVDSKTGEVRSCGDLSGYCVGMNPWKTPLPAEQSAPIVVDTAKPDSSGSTPTSDQLNASPPPAAKQPCPPRRRHAHLTRRWLHWID